MLKSLYISNYALISELRIDFGNGFSSITGETGAGKSIIMGALSLILGQRAELKAIKADEDKCVIEAEFDIAAYPHLASFFTENDLDVDGNSCLIRRELTSAGKSRAFINDSPVSLNVLRDLTVQLIDIHSQHDNLLLTNTNYQLQVVDTVAANQSLFSTYTDAYTTWLQLKADLRKLEHDAGKYASELDYLRFQYKQLEDAKLQEDEQVELEEEQKALAHAEEIKTELTTAQYLLDDEKAVLPMLKETMAAIGKIKDYLPQSDTWLGRLQTTYIEIKDIDSEIVSVAERTEFNPARLEYVDNRLSEIYSLQKKYKVSTVSELLELKADFESKLEKIDSFDDEIDALKKKIAAALELLKKSADKLSDSRKKISASIEHYLVEQLTKLGMPNIRFKVQINELSDFSEMGKDEVQFLFSANKNRDMQAVQLVASGGEISRLMLAVKSMIANRANLPTIIFDEIDTGVSGEIAHRMGDIMNVMGKSMQVITITHLPQIAAKSVAQYKVYKDDTGMQTETYISKLDDNQRISEIAEMLSGKNPTEAAIQNAKELLNQK